MREADVNSTSQHSHDVFFLREVIKHADLLREGEEDAFSSMLERLETRGGDARVLTPKQRAWLEDAADRVEVEDPADDPAERNKDVPRGREVKMASVLANRPLAPPGRRVK